MTKRTCYTVIIQHKDTPECSVIMGFDSAFYLFDHAASIIATTIKGEKIKRVVTETSEGVPVLGLWIDGRAMVTIQESPIVDNIIEIDEAMEGIKGVTSQTTTKEKYELLAGKANFNHALTMKEMNSYVDSERERHEKFIAQEGVIDWGEANKFVVEEPNERIDKVIRVMASYISTEDE